MNIYVHFFLLPSISLSFSLDPFEVFFTLLLQIPQTKLQYFLSFTWDRSPQSAPYWSKTRRVITEKCPKVLAAADGASYEMVSCSCRAPRRALPADLTAKPPGSYLGFKCSLQLATVSRDRLSVTAAVEDSPREAVWNDGYREERGAGADLMRHERSQIDL